MDAKRLILSFDKDIYNEESKVWYIMDCILTPTIADVLIDIAQKFECSHRWTVYINGIAAPPWIPTKYIHPANDDIRLDCSKEFKPLPNNFETNIVENHKSNHIEKSESPSSMCFSTVKDSQDDLVIKSSKADLCIYKENQTQLKINNNFKRKFPATTPTQKDKYSNRSKVYISPGAKKSIPKSSVPVANALKTAVKETLQVTMPMPVNDINEVKDSHFPSVKTKMLKDRVDSLLAAKITEQKMDSNSDSDSSMTSSSSDEKTCSRELKRPKLDKTQNSKSSDTSSEEDISVSNALPDTEIKTLIKSEESKGNIMAKLSNTSVKESGAIIKNPVPSITSDDSDSDIAEAKVSNTKESSTSSSSDSNSSEEDNETNGLITVGKIDQCINKHDNNSCIDSEKENKHINCMEYSNASKLPSPVLKDYTAFADLQGTPRVSDKLAFKMLDLNESYCPVISDYKEGVITDYNSVSQSVTIQLFPKFVEMQQKSGKFELDEDVKMCDLLDLNLKQLIEPKILSSV